MAHHSARCPVRRKCAFLLVTMLFLFSRVVIPASSAQRPQATEYQVKAAYLYQFGKFVQWPAGSQAAKDNSFIVCVLGQDPFGTILEASLVGETIDGKGVVPRRIAKPQDSLGCRILFISPSEEKELNNILAAIDRTGVLTVSEIPRFSERGGMIQLLSEGKRVRFEINLTAAKNAGLGMSSELLKLATVVRRSPQPGD